MVDHINYIVTLLVTWNVMHAMVPSIPLISLIAHKGK